MVRHTGNPSCDLLNHACHSGGRGTRATRESIVHGEGDDDLCAAVCSLPMPDLDWFHVDLPPQLDLDALSPSAEAVNDAVTFSGCRCRGRPSSREVGNLAVVWLTTRFSAADTA